MARPLTYGLTHVAVGVVDLKRTKKFYCRVFDMKVMYDNPDFLQLTTSGSHDILVFEKKPKSAIGNAGGIVHYGFRLRSPKGITEFVKRLKKAGGKVKDQGEFVPGSPFVFFSDPDGYEVEVWFEQTVIG